MKPVFKVVMRFEAKCEYWLDGTQFKNEEEAKQEALKRIYNGEIGQYLTIVDATAKSVEKLQIRNEYYTD